MTTKVVATSRRCKECKVTPSNSTERPVSDDDVAAMDEMAELS